MAHRAVGTERTRVNMVTPHLKRLSKNRPRRRQAGRRAHRPDQERGQRRINMAHHAVGTERTRVNMVNPQIKRLRKKRPRCRQEGKTEPAKLTPGAVKHTHAVVPPPSGRRRNHESDSIKCRQSRCINDCGSTACLPLVDSIAMNLTHSFGHQMPVIEAMLGKTSQRQSTGCSRQGSHGRKRRVLKLYALGT